MFYRYILIKLNENRVKICHVCGSMADFRCELCQQPTCYMHIKLTKTKKYGSSENWCSKCRNFKKIFYGYGLLLLLFIFLPFLLVPPNIAVDLVVIIIIVGLLLLLAIGAVWIYKIYKIQKLNPPDQ